MAFCEIVFLIPVLDGVTPVLHSAAMRHIAGLSLRLGGSDIPVLLTGETGVGKEVVANLIHQAGPRRNRRMIAVNCAAVPEPLAEAEFFGTMKGAYTGAGVSRSGYFQQASHSTIFLDELADMPMNIQTKLLRVLQDGRVRRVGAVDEDVLDFRLIAAINRPGEDCVRDGKLRVDLFHRLNAITIEVPPLRERREEIIPLVSCFLRMYGQPAPVLGLPLAKRLETYWWPGNVRELKNCIQRACVLYPGKRLCWEDLGIKTAVATAGHRRDHEVEATQPPSAGLDEPLGETALRA